MTTPTTPNTSTNGSGPGPFKYCGAFGVPAFLWPDAQPCPGPTTEVNTHGPLPLPDYSGPVNAVTGAANAVTGALNPFGDIPNSLSSAFDKLTSAAFWKGFGLVLAAGVLFIGGFIIWMKGPSTTNVTVQEHGAET